MIWKTLLHLLVRTFGEDNVVVKVTGADGNPIDAKIKWIGSHVEIDVAQLNPWRYNSCKIFICYKVRYPNWKPICKYGLCCRIFRTLSW